MHRLSHLVYLSALALQPFLKLPQFLLALRQSLLFLPDLCDHLLDLGVGFDQGKRVLGRMCAWFRPEPLRWQKDFARTQDTHRSGEKENRSNECEHPS